MGVAISSECNFRTQTFEPLARVASVEEPPKSTESRTPSSSYSVNVSGRPKIDGLKIVLSYVEVRSAFVNFLQCGNNAASVRSVLKRWADLRSLPYHDLELEANQIAGKYQKPDIHSKIGDVNLFSPVNTRVSLNNQHAVQLFEQCLNETASMIILQIISSFLRSTQYKTWSNGNGKQPHTTYCSTPKIDGSPTVILECLLNCWKSSNLEKDMMIALNTHFCLDTIERIFMSRSWVETLIRALDSLPVSASLADADNCNEGFPLIFVNKKFESLTGYSFAQIRGMNNRFLQGELTERKSVERLAEALQVAKPVKVQLTNYRSDGTPFLNLLSLTPVLDLNAKFCFVIGIQFDCNAAGSDVKLMHLVDTFISLLPNTCPIWKSR